MTKITLIAAAAAALTLTACAGDHGATTEGLLLNDSGSLRSSDQQAGACDYWRNIRQSEVQSDTAVGPLPGLEGGARSRILRQRALRECPQGTRVPDATDQKQEEKPAQPPA